MMPDGRTMPWTCPKTRWGALGLILGAVLFACPAAFSQTTVSDVILSPVDGLPVAARVTITPGTALTYQARSYGQAARVITAASGAISVSLIPNDSAVPADPARNWYLVRYDAGSKGRWQEYWYVPASGDALKIHQVRVNAAPSGAAPSAPANTYTARFSGAVELAVAAATHGMGRRVIVDCYTPAGVAVMPGPRRVDPDTGDVTVRFAVAQDGYCVVRGGAASSYAKSFSGSAALAVSAQEHGLAMVLRAAVYDAAGWQVMSGPISLTSTGTGSADVLVTLSEAMAAATVVVFGG